MTRMGGPPVTLMAVTSTVPLSAGRSPQMVSASSFWPLPATPAMPTISPERTESESLCRASSPLSLSASRSVTTRRSSPSTAGGFSSVKRTSRPTMRLAHSGLVMPSASTVAIHLPARSTVMRSAMERTSSSLWLMKMMVLPSRRHLAQRVEEGFGLLRREDGGRFVEDEDVGPAIELFDDLDALLFADGKLPDLEARVDRQTVLLANTGDLLFDAAGVEDQADVAQAEDDVLGDGHGVDEHEVLVDHADAGLNSVAGEWKTASFAVDGDGSRCPA